MSHELEVRPSIGKENEHVCRDARIPGADLSQRRGAEAAQTALCELLYPNQSRPPIYGLYRNLYEGSWGDCGGSYAAGETLAPLFDGSAAYLDLFQLELSSAECLRADELYRRIVATEYLAARAVATAELPVHTFLMNRSLNGDGNGHVYRAGHINVMVRRAFFSEMAGESFGMLLRAYVPALLAAGVLLGSGCVADEADEDMEPGKVLCSQRLCAQSCVYPSFETTRSRSFTLNLRGLAEPMSDSRIEPAAIRNHVIGPQDSTVAPIEELRLFLTQAVSYLFLRTDLPLPDLTLAHPLQAGVIWNQDPWSEVALANGRRMNALDMAEASLEGMAGVLGRLGTADWALPGWSGYADWYTHIIDLLRRLEFEAAAGHLEWVAKSLAFDGLEPEIARDVEVLYHEITPDLFVEGGEHLARDLGLAPPFSEEELLSTLTTPPEDTRAYLRGHLARAASEAGEEIEMVGWDAVSFRHRRVTVCMPQAEMCTRADLPDLSGMDLDEILQAAADFTVPYTFGQRRTQHHQIRGGTAKAIVPKAAN